MGAELEADEDDPNFDSKYLESNENNNWVYKRRGD